MIVRPYTDADFAQIKHLHQQSGFPYSLPTPTREAFFSARVVGDNESIGMAAFLRHTAEVYLIPDPTWRNAAWREAALRKLTEVCAQDCRDNGVLEMVGFLPPQIAKTFGNRLKKLNWSFYKGDEWKAFGYEV